MGLCAVNFARLEISRRRRPAQPADRSARRPRCLCRRRVAAGAEGSRRMRRIPATIVTGFSAPARRAWCAILIGAATGHRLAIIVNELGELGIDRELMLGCGDENCRDDDIVELANGAPRLHRRQRFRPTLTKLIDRPKLPDHILIKTSGLALPKPLVQAFAWPEIRTATTVDGVQRWQIFRLGHHGQG